MSPSGPTLIRPLVLIVDDDAAVLEALAALLAPRLEPLYRIEVAGSAEEALEIVGSGTSDPRLAPVALVVSDERMPGKQGTDLLVTLRQHPAHRHGGRIIVTAYAGLASAEKAINEAEVDRYFPKPWNAEGALLPAIGEILARFQRTSGMGSYLETAPSQGDDDLREVDEIRRAWREYLELMGGPPAADPDVDSKDPDTTWFLARRRSPDEDIACGAIRLGRDAAKSWTLDGQAFLPGHFDDCLEALLAHTAVVHARGAGIERLRIQAPSLRAGTYEALGFRRRTDPAADIVPGCVPMEIEPGLGSGSAPHAPFEARYRKESRLCACYQVGCPARDYAASARGYFCPLDLRERRMPDGFPAPDGGGERS